MGQSFFIKQAERLFLSLQLEVVVKCSHRYCSQRLRTLDCELLIPLKICSVRFIPCNFVLQTKNWDQKSMFVGNSETENPVLCLCTVFGHSAPVGGAPPYLSQSLVQIAKCCIVGCVLCVLEAECQSEIKNLLQVMWSSRAQKVCHLAHKLQPAHMCM